MTYDEGSISICELKNTAEMGQMPKEQLIKEIECFFGDRSVGYNRQYAAKGVNEQIDRIVRTWRNKNIRIGMYAVTEDGEQYRIDNVQSLLDEDGLQVTDITLRRLDKLYDVAAET